MQASLKFPPTLFSSSPASASNFHKSVISIPVRSQRLPCIRATSLANESSSVDYSSSLSVFPAEACETIGGDACFAYIFPEVKLEKEGTSNRNTGRTAHSEVVERDYLEYKNNPKTVLLAEACDVLGGEFCEPPYQRGIF